jgi:hypothetical protein
MTRALALLRIQDDEGRGPFRPGLSIRWVDMDRDDHDLCPAIFQEAPDWLRKIDSAKHLGLRYFGCASFGVDGIRRWFNPLEVERLRTLGFWLADASDAKEVLRTDTQAVIGSTWKLSKLPRVPWAVIE